MEDRTEEYGGQGRNFRHELSFSSRSQSLEENRVSRVSFYYLSARTGETMDVIHGVFLGLIDNPRTRGLLKIKHEIDWILSFNMEASVFFAYSLTSADILRD